MRLITRTLKKEIKNLKRSNKSMEDRFDYLRLDKNERLLPIKKSDLQSFVSSISGDDITGYPEINLTYKKLSKFLKINTNELLIAAGSDLAIKSIFETFVSKKDSVVLQSPSYAMTEIYAKMIGAKVKYFKTDKNLNIKIKNIYSQIDKKTKLVVIENPSGFVGSTFKRSEIKILAKYLLNKKILLLIDEAYFYVENNKFNKRHLIKKYPNIIISQTFSKAHGLAGIRFGYLISNSKIMKFLKKVIPMHEISSLSIKAAHWVLDKPRMVKEFQQSIKKSKKYLAKELINLKMNYKMTPGNFFLINAPNFGKTKNLSEKLKQKNILIRRPFEQKEIKGWIRVCVGSASDCKKFIRAIKSILNEYYAN